MASDMVFVFKREHEDNLCFNLGGGVGIDQLVGQACLEHNVKYHLYLPFAPEVQSKYWEEEQKKTLENQILHCTGIDIMNPAGHDMKDYQLRNMKMVDDASFVVAFWVGKKRGATYNCMKYSLKQSKFVFNALNGLRPVFKNELFKGWTPPTVRK
jgi:uncharacterized phage-like protein YoqJ